MKQRHPGHQTQWAAQFAVASELCKRGYQVALTLGNHPAVDLMVRSPRGIQFGIDVKGLYKSNFWPIKQTQRQENLYYVFAFVPKEKLNRFFIMPQADVTSALQGKLKKSIEKGKSADKENKFPCLPFELGNHWENNWKILPA